MAEKGKVNVGVNNGKMGRPAPDWLCNLKDGVYTVTELMEISGKSSSNIMHRMKTYAKKVTYVVQDNGRASARYHWDQKHFLKITVEMGNNN